MQLLPGYEKAVIPIQKLRTYALNADHPEGKHKARVFKAALGIEQAHADVFARILRESLPRSPATLGVEDQHGRRWATYHEIVGLRGQPEVVTCVWILRPEQPDVPVLVSCYLEPQGRAKLEQARASG